MLSRTIDDDHRYRIKYRSSAHSDYMSKTLDSDRFMDVRSKTTSGNHPIKLNTPKLSYTQHSQQIHSQTRIKAFEPYLQTTKPLLKAKKTKLRSSLPKKIQHLILNQGITHQAMSSKQPSQGSPVRNNRFSDSFNNIVFNYKPKITNSIQPTKASSILASQVTKSLDYSQIFQTIKAKPKPKPKQKRSKQLQEVFMKTKLLLDQYKEREQNLLVYIKQLQSEIATFKEKQ